MTPQRIKTDALADVDFRQLFDESPAGMAVVSLDGRWQRVNRALCEILGYPEDQLVGRAFVDAADPVDIVQGTELIRRLLADEIRNFQIDKRHRKLDDTIVWIRSWAALVRDEGGAPLHIVTQVQDITATKEVELELARERQLLAESQAAGCLGSWELDLETGQQKWSREQFQLHGVDPSGPAPQLDEWLELI